MPNVGRSSLATRRAKTRHVVVLVLLIVATGLAPTPAALPPVPVAACVPEADLETALADEKVTDAGEQTWLRNGAQAGAVADAVSRFVPDLYAGVWIGGDRRLQVNVKATSGSVPAHLSEAVRQIAAQCGVSEIDVRATKYSRVDLDPVMAWMNSHYEEMFAFLSYHDDLATGTIEVQAGNPSTRSAQTAQWMALLESKFGAMIVDTGLSPRPEASLL